MLFIIFTLIFSVTLVLMSVSYLHRFSPYNHITVRNLRVAEQVLLHFILSYPFFSMLLLLMLPGNIIAYLSSDTVDYRKAYYTFCIAHVALSIIAATICYSLRKQSRFFNAFFIFSALTGGGYLTAVIGALAESTRH